MRVTTQILVVLFCVLVALQVNAQLNHVGLQFSRLTSEFPDFITIDEFDDDFAWQSFFAEPIRSAEIVYSKSISNNFSYHVQLGYTSFVYGLSTSESFLFQPEVERQYQSRFVTPGSSLHYHLPRPLDNFHISAGLVTHFLLNSRIITWTAQENGSLLAEESTNDNINNVILIPRFGLHYSIGNETISITLSSYANAKLSSFYASFNDTAERFAASFSVAGYLNLNRLNNNRRLSEYQNGLLGLAL